MWSWTYSISLLDSGVNRAGNAIQLESIVNGFCLVKGLDGVRLYRYQGLGLVASWMHGISRIVGGLVEDRREVGRVVTCLIPSNECPHSK
jgi:hypothetical protein